MAQMGSEGTKLKEDKEKERRRQRERERDRERGKEILLYDENALQLSDGLRTLSHPRIPLVPFTLPTPVLCTPLPRPRLLLFLLCVSSYGRAAAAEEGLRKSEQRVTELEAALAEAMNTEVGLRAGAEAAAVDAENALLTVRREGGGRLFFFLLAVSNAVSLFWGVGGRDDE